MTQNKPSFTGIQALRALGRTMTYIPALNEVTGSITATVLLQQILYWSELDKNDTPGVFYKFIQPCNHKLYRPGDSWVEELNISYSQLTNALKRIGTKVTSGTKRSTIFDTLRPEYMVLYWTDRNRVTWWEVNHQAANHYIEQVIRRPPFNSRKPNYVSNSKKSNPLCNSKKSNYIDLYTEKIYKDDLLHTGEAQLTEVEGHNSDTDTEGERRDGKAVSIDLDLTEEKEGSKGSEINGDLVSTNEVTLNLGFPHEISGGLKGESVLFIDSDSVSKTPLTPLSPAASPIPPTEQVPQKTPVGAPNPSRQAKTRQNSHELVRGLISQRCDDVSGFLAWRGEQLRQTDAYKQGNMTPAVVLQFYAKRIASGPWTSEQDRQCSIDNVQTMIEADVERYPRKSTKQVAECDVLSQVFALYQTDKVAARALAQQHRVWNKFLKEYSHAI